MRLFPIKGHLNIKKKEGQSQFWLWLALHSLHENFQIINPTQEKTPIHIPVANNKFQKFQWRTTRMNKYPSKKGTSPFWMHMVSFFGKGCKPSRVPQTKNRLEIKNVRNNFHSKRWFLHSEWRTEKSPLRTENSPFRGISPFWMEKTLRKTLIYRF